MQLADTNVTMVNMLRQTQELLSLACAQAFHLDTTSSSKPHDTLVYALRLQENKYYVGKTQHLLRRFVEHKAGHGAAWTRKYKPVRIEATYPCLVDGMENAVVKMYMMTKGVHNVRGGAYVTDTLSPGQVAFIEAELVHDADQCFLCHGTGHYARECPARHAPGPSASASALSLDSPALAPAPAVVVPEDEMRFW
jgi:predicted GIY-YIG superfamily endonuclease